MTLRTWLSFVVVFLAWSSTAFAAHDEWRERYQRARAALIEHREQDALDELEQIAESAPTTEERKAALELAEVARARLAIERRQVPQPKIRTSDELALLYTTSFIYGFGTSGWLALQLKPQSFPAAVLPFIGLTTASVGGVAVIDGHRPFRLGVPQAIAGGMYLGLGEAIWLVGHQHSKASRLDDDSHWRAETVSTLLWSGATIGAVAGGLVGAHVQPTPGQVSFTSSGTLWGGMFTALVAPSLQSDPERAGEVGFLGGLVGYNVGLVGGIAFASRVRPSVARVRFVDLGGVAGGLLGAGTYLLVLGDDAAPRGGMLAAGLGVGAGLGLSWWITDRVDDHPTAPSTGVVASLRPVLAPTQGGWSFGVTGSL